MKKAQYFITCHDLPVRNIQEIHPENVKRLLTKTNETKRDNRQLSFLFGD